MAHLAYFHEIRTQPKQECG